MQTITRAERIHFEQARSWLTFSAATATLLTLSWCNAIRTPAFDALRAGSYLLRDRRGALVALIATERSGCATHCRSVARAPQKLLSKTDI
jgi:hypothetical protein